MRSHITPQNGDRRSKGEHNRPVNLPVGNYYSKIGPDEVFANGDAIQFDRQVIRIEIH